VGARGTPTEVCGGPGLAMKQVSREGRHMHMLAAGIGGIGIVGIVIIVIIVVVLFARR
jgi:hypothetical protein